MRGSRLATDRRVTSLQVSLRLSPIPTASVGCSNLKVLNLRIVADGLFLTLTLSQSFTVFDIFSYSYLSDLHWYRMTRQCIELAAQEIRRQTLTVDR